jgi:hypothetical protein
VKHEDYQDADEERAAAVVHTQHVISVVPRPKMDTPTGLFSWECSCGRVSTMVGTERQAQKAGDHHKEAKEGSTE